MDPLPFYTDSFADGAVAMTFRAYFLRDADDYTMLDVRCIAADPTRDLLERHVYRCGLRPFLCSRMLRDHTVSYVLFRLASVDATAVALFWKDFLLFRCVEGALRFLLLSSSFPLRGIRFSVEFRVLRRRRVVGASYPMIIDDVLVIDGNEAGRSVPVEKLKRDEESQFGEKECVICLEDFEASKGEEDLGRMPCFHIFHYRCLEKWLRVKSSCPTCRREIGTADAKKL